MELTTTEEEETFKIIPLQEVEDTLLEEEEVETMATSQDARFAIMLDTLLISVSIDLIWIFHLLEVPTTLSNLGKGATTSVLT